MSRANSCDAAHNIWVCSHDQEVIEGIVVHNGRVENGINVNTMNLELRKKGKGGQKMSRMSDELRQLVRCSLTSVDELGGTWEEVRR